MATFPIDLFHPHISDWFRRTLGEPTAAQSLGWPPIARGESTLLLAPTGSGKTLAAFLVAIDRLIRDPNHDDRASAPAAARRASDARRAVTRVVYVSPLKALAIDVERNLRVPLEGIRAANAPLASRMPTVQVRTGDTPAKDRARFARSPADILITTPESLYLLLTSRARETLSSVETVIVDEIHALVPTKRGAHLAVSLERLEALRPRGAAPLQRIGLSATQRPIDEAARLLGGFDGGAPRAVTIVDAGPRKTMQLLVEAASRPRAVGKVAQDALRERGTWPDIYGRVVDLVRAHRSTIVFVNSRRLAERLAAAVNEVAGEELALAHHGSLSREKRAATEERLKGGDLRAIVATSSLELGIDMGAVDLVVQIESPPSVASGLQRVGRACHGVGGVPRGVLLPKHRHDLLACAAAVSGMRAGDVEDTSYPRNPLDLLAQQIVAAASMDVLGVEDAFRMIRRAAPFVDLSRDAFEGVLDMLSGRYPSDDFAELRPRITWDRMRETIEGRRGAHRLAVTSGGTIPDRGLYGVFTETAPADPGARAAATRTTRAPTGGRRVGELDEEMVFELREGEVFMLGASSWRADRITHDRVIASPAPGEPGKMPFWHGDRLGRSRAFGLRIGELVRRIADGRTDATVLRDAHAMAAPAAEATMAYVREQIEAIGEAPTDRTVVVERFVDEVGDWRVVVCCPLGTRVLAPWAIAVAATLRKTYIDADLHYIDDGMAFRIPACDSPPPTELFFPSASDVEATVTRELHGTALFAARFRECAARALLLPRGDPRAGRTPLWAQRRRARDLLAVASRHPDFPIVLETYRECLRDAFDMTGLCAVLRDIEARRVRVATVDARGPSPFAASVLFSFVAGFIYEADAPPAERRALSLTVDFERLKELLGESEIRGLLDPDVIVESEQLMQRLARRAESLDAVSDMLLALGDLSRAELRERCQPEHAEDWVRDLLASGRAIEIRVAGELRIAAVEDAARLRGALGVDLPPGIPAALLRPCQEPLRDVVARYARTHGPFATRDVARRFGIPEPAVEAEIATLIAQGRLVEGAFLPGGTSRELCGRDVLDTIRRKSLSKIRRAIEPVQPTALARLLPVWQGLEERRRGPSGLLAVIAELQGCPLVASTLESHVLPARIEPYRPWDLDALCASGEVVWAGLEPLGTQDGRICLYLAHHEALLARAITPVPGEAASVIRGVLARRGAVFFGDLIREVGRFPSDVLDVLWQMVWAGEATNDTLEPLRSRARALSAESRRRPHPRRPREARPQRVGREGAQGRWSLRSSRWADPPAETDKRVALAHALLERYGVVTREAAHAEGVVGGFSAVYDVFKGLEEKGLVHRGYFVEGRGGAQFARPGAGERLRNLRDARSGIEPIVVAATDPANAWGAVLEWPETPGIEARPQRAAGAVVVLRDGELLAWVGRGVEHPVITFLPGGDASRTEAAGAIARAIAGLVESSARPALLVSTIDGVEASRSPFALPFSAAGFVATARGLLKRRSTPKVVAR